MVTAPPRLWLLCKLGLYPPSPVVRLGEGGGLESGTVVGARPSFPVCNYDPGPHPCPSGSRRYLVPDSGPEQSLVDKSLRAFVREVGARSATPGGGSVAAASAAMVSWGRSRERGGDGRWGLWTRTGW